MTPTLNAEQRELQDTLRNFLSERITSAVLRSEIDAGTDFNSARWAELRSLGIFELFEDTSNEGGGSQELGIIAFEAGRALLREPLARALLCGPLLLKHAGAEARAFLKKQTDASDARIGQGEVWGACALYREQTSGKKRSRASRAPTGTVSIDASALSARYLLVHTEGASAAEPRWWLIVPPHASLEQVAARPTRTLDLTAREARLVLEKLPGFLLTEEDSRWFRCSLWVLTACELAGLASRCVEMTVEYVKTRKQFGVPVGCFQAVQHQLVDAHLKAESARALAFFAAWSVDYSPSQCEFAARAALWHAREVVPEVIERAIQLHGGIGFTWEHDLHLYLRRAKRMEILTEWLVQKDQTEEFLALVQ